MAMKPAGTSARGKQAFVPLSQSHPLLAAQWHPTKNGKLTPDDIKENNTRPIWWVCPKGHEWQARTWHRTHQGNACPFCAGRKVAPEDTLLVRFPAIAAEWHPTKNGGVIVLPEHKTFLVALCEKPGTRMEDDCGSPNYSRKWLSLLFGASADSRKLIRRSLPQLGRAMASNQKRKSQTDGFSCCQPIRCVVAVSEVRRSFVEVENSLARTKSGTWLPNLRPYREQIACAKTTSRNTSSTFE